MGTTQSQTAGDQATRLSAELEENLTTQKRIEAKIASLRAQLKENGTIKAQSGEHSEQPKGNRSLSTLVVQNSFFGTSESQGEIKIVDGLVDRKKRLHLDTFKLGLEDTLHTFDQLAQKGGKLEARIAKDRWAEGSITLEDFRLVFMEKGRAVLTQHESVASEEFAKHEVYRGLVKEMLRTKDALLSALQLYLEDQSKSLYFMRSQPIFEFLRDYHAYLWHTLPENTEERRVQATRLGHSLGLFDGSPNAKDQTGLTVLMRAATEGLSYRDLACIAWAGADVNAQDDKGRTAVYMAAEYGYVDVVRDLARLGADINKTDESDDAPIHKASKNDHVDVIKVLASLGADLNKPDKWTGTPMICAVGHINSVKVLASLGADVNKPNSIGRTPLHGAAGSNSADVIKVLVSHGADVNKPDNFNSQPIHVAAMEGSVDAIKALASLGADLNKKDNDDKTPMLYAQVLNKQAAIEALEALGAQK